MFLVQIWRGLWWNFSIHWKLLSRQRSKKWPNIWFKIDMDKNISHIDDIITMLQLYFYKIHILLIIIKILITVFNALFVWYVHDLMPWFCMIKRFVYLFKSNIYDYLEKLKHYLQKNFSNKFCQNDSYL